MQLKNPFHQKPSSGRPAGKAVFTSFAPESDVGPEDVRLLPGQIVHFIAGGELYIVTDITREYRCIISGGRFKVAGQSAVIAGAIQDGNPLGANIAFHHGVPTKFTGCVILPKYWSDINVRPRAELSLMTPPVQCLSINNELIF